jgi:hypothetical protein
MQLEAVEGIFLQGGVRLGVVASGEERAPGVGVEVEATVPRGTDEVRHEQRAKGSDAGVS